MPPQRDPETLAGPVLAAGAFAAGAAAALVAKRLVDRRRKGGDTPDELGAGDDGGSEDVASVLRRAALDVAVLATGQAAERLQSDGSETSSA